MNTPTVNESIAVLAEALAALSAGKDAPFSKDFLNFNAVDPDTNYTKGIIFTGHGATKQLVLVENPDRFFMSEHVDIGTDKAYHINGAEVLSQNSLGAGVTRSNLQQLGHLKGLVVDGQVAFNQYFFYLPESDRIGLGTDEPNAALSIAEDAIEVMLGTREHSRGMVGTFAHTHFDIVTDNTPRITVEAGGNIHLGNKLTSPITVSINGTLAVGVNTPDARASLHVNGPIKFNGNIHMSSIEAPKDGQFNVGDIVWNSNPQEGLFVGWVCVRAGTPGVWNPFGQIGPVQ